MASQIDVQCKSSRVSSHPDRARQLGSDVSAPSYLDQGLGCCMPVVLSVCMMSCYQHGGLCVVQPPGQGSGAGLNITTVRAADALRTPCASVASPLSTSMKPRKHKGCSILSDVRRLSTWLLMCLCSCTRLAR